MLALTESISARKGHLTYLALVGLLFRMNALMVDKFGVFPEVLPQCRQENE